MSAVVVCGGRSYDNLRGVCDALDQIDAEIGITFVATGDAAGVDSDAQRWARIAGKRSMIFRAEWDRFGFRAGPIRNAQMLKRVRPDLVIAFPGGKGTADTVRKARSAGYPVREVAP